MGEALITRRGGTGGAGGGMNYKVIGVAAEANLPTTAKENTFAVITDAEIGNSFFQVSKPTTAVNGDIWFETGFTKTAREFNAIKKGSLQIYPRRTYQYDGTAWKNKAARIYQNGGWKSVSFFIYNNGNVEGISFSWIAGRALDGGRIEVYSNYVVATTGSWGGQSVGPSITFDFTNYKTLRINSTGTLERRYHISGVTWDYITNNNFLIDISSINGMHFIDVSAVTPAAKNENIVLYGIEFI